MLKKEKIGQEQKTITVIMESQEINSVSPVSPPSPLPTLHYIDYKVGKLLEDLKCTATIRLFEERIFDFFQKQFVGAVLFLQEAILCYPENLENCSDVLFVAAPFSSTMSREERSRRWSMRESFLREWLVIKGYTDPNTLFRINAELNVRSASDEESMDTESVGYSSDYESSDDEGINYEIVQGAKVWYYTDDLKVKKKLKLCHPTREVTQMNMPWGALVILDKDGSFAYISFPQILSVEYPSFSVIIVRLDRLHLKMRREKK